MSRRMDVRRRRRWLAAVGAALVLGPGAAAEAAASPPTIERETVRSHDGTRLRGWIIRPTGANEQKRLPTVLITSPYLGQCVKVVSFGGGPCYPTPAKPENWDAHPEPVRQLVEWGYAVAWFSVRGTGISGGCWDSMGKREQRDQREVVEWIAGRKWSSGKVGAMGLSYMSATALEAAIERPRALKTVVVAGVLGDLYTYQHTPQGLSASYNHLFDDGRYAADVSLLPPGPLSGEPEVTAERLPEHAERACPEVARIMTAGPAGALSGHRDGEFWAQRRLADRFDRIKAAVLVAQGLPDLFGSGHKMQEDAMWSQIRAPKAMWLGQWDHSWPYEPSTPFRVREDLRDSWWATLRSWLDHHLRDGERPEVSGVVRFEDEAGTWHESDRWPPRESRPEALFLAPGESLTAARPSQEAGVTFRSAPPADRTAARHAYTCPGWLDAGGPLGRVFMTAPVAERTVIAGNPMVYLDLEADQPGGAVQVMLHDVGPGFDCGADPSRRAPADSRALTIGGADLRFHHGGFSARPFTGGHVRVDLANLAAVLEPGHRLALTVGYGDPYEYDEVGHAPLVAIRSGPRPDSSQIVVPVLRGGFGGDPPPVPYPPRP